MEAAVDAPRKLEGEKAQRIVAAMRASVGARGAAGSTFDVVAREAGVSRGLLHYYFGSKERLLVEVVRRDCEVRVRSWTSGSRSAHRRRDRGRARGQRSTSSSRTSPARQAVIYEMLSASRHCEEIRAEMAELYRHWREHLADGCARRSTRASCTLTADPEAVASILSSRSATASACSCSPIPTGIAGRVRARRRDRAPAARR